MENPLKMDDLGVPLFLETHLFSSKTPGLRRGFSTSSKAQRFQRGFVAGVVEGGLEVFHSNGVTIMGI